MEREVGELVAKDANRVASVRSGGAALHNDTMRFGEGDRRTPFGRAGSHPVAEMPPVRRQLEKDALPRTWKAREGVRAGGRVEERPGERLLALEKNRGESAAVDPQRGDGLR